MTPTGWTTWPTATSGWPTMRTPRGAAGGSYTLVDADVGKAIKVRVGFTDDGGNPESLTSPATAPVTVPAGDETEYSCPVWSATLTVGRVGENYGYQSFLNPQAGSLIPNSFVLDGVTYTVGSIETAADYFTAFGVDRKLPVGFTLELDGAQFESSDASPWSLSYGHVYTWPGRGMDWDVGEEVAVSLILQERVENTPQTGGPAICGTPNSPAKGAPITLPTSPILAPFNLTARGSEGSGVSLRWDAPHEDADSVTGYQVLRGQGDGELETLVGDTQSADTTYTDTAVSGGAIDLAAYRYQVKALRNGEASLGSNVADVLVSQLAHQTSHPGPVQNLRYTGAPGYNATFVWWKGPRFDGGVLEGFYRKMGTGCDGASPVGSVRINTGVGLPPGHGVPDSPGHSPAPKVPPYHERNYGIDLYMGGVPEGRHIMVWAKSIDGVYGDCADLLFNSPPHQKKELEPIVFQWGNYWALRQLDDYFGDVDEPNDPTLAAFQVAGCWADDVPTQAEYEAVNHPRLTYTASSSDTIIVTVKLVPHDCVIPVVTVGTERPDRQNPPPAYLRKNYLEIRTVGEGSATVSVTVTDHKGEKYTQTTDVYVPASSVYE